MNEIEMFFGNNLESKDKRKYNSSQLVGARIHFLDKKSSSYNMEA